MKTTLTILVFILTISYANAQINTWKPKGVPTTKKSTSTVNFKKYTNPNYTKVKKIEEYQKKAEAVIRSSIKFNSISEDFPGGKTVLKKVNNNIGITDFKSTPGTPIIKGNMKCTPNKLDIKTVSQSIGAYGSVNDADWILPGLIMENKNVINGSFKIKSDLGEMKPFTIMNNKSGKNIKVVSPHRKSNISTAVKLLKNQLGKNDLQTLFVGSYKEVYSLEEIGFRIEGKYSLSVPAVVNVDISSSAKSKTKNEKYYYLIKFEQKLFDIEVEDYAMLDTKNNIFKSGIVNLDNLVYISNVNYGRRAIVIVSSTQQFAKNELKIQTSFETLTQEGRLSFNGETLKEGSEINIESIFYGGDTNAAIEDFYKTARSKRINIKNYLTKNATSVHEALPISYQLKNFNGDIVGMVSDLTQSVETCTPVSGITLQIKLEALYCTESDDSDSTDDYAFNQWVILKIGNRYKKAVKLKRPLHSNYTPPELEKENVARKITLLMTGGRDNQIAVKEGEFKELNHWANFSITPKELKLIEEGNYRLEISNNIQEYSPREIELLSKRKVDVDLNKVINNLMNIKNLETKGGYKDGWVQYELSGPRFNMRKYRKESDDIYGYIGFNKEDRKARAKMRFKLIK